MFFRFTTHTRSLFLFSWNLVFVATLNDTRGSTQNSAQIHFSNRQVRNFPRRSFFFSEFTEICNIKLIETFLKMCLNFVVLPVYSLSFVYWFKYTCAYILFDRIVCPSDIFFISELTLSRKNRAQPNALTVLLMLKIIKYISTAIFVRNCNLAWKWKRVSRVVWVESIQHRHYYV